MLNESNRCHRARWRSILRVYGDGRGLGRSRLLFLTLQTDALPVLSPLRIERHNVEVVRRQATYGSHPIT
ncbi:hypothetical protein [Egbenema bharatensis]|uniref:hypothetical protein n=1 Tax=Egbenema bharatensis TaxID=3463334 RepID=UPI003A887B10